MDSTDRKILDILKTDARISMRELGERVSLSNTATAERVRKMEEAEIILGYETIVNNEALGFTVHSFINLELFPDGRRCIDKLLNYMKKTPGIISSHQIFTGDTDFIIQVACKNLPELNEIQMDLCNFGSTKTYISGAKRAK